MEWIFRFIMGAAGGVLVYLIYGAVSGKLHGWKPAVVLVALILFEIGMGVAYGLCGDKPLLPEYKCDLEIRDNAAYVTVENVRGREKEFIIIRLEQYVPPRQEGRRGDYWAKISYYINGEEIESGKPSRTINIERDEKKTFTIQTDYMPYKETEFRIHVAKDRGDRLETVWTQDIDINLIRSSSETKYECNFEIRDNTAYLTVENVGGREIGIIIISLQGRREGVTDTWGAVSSPYYINGEKQQLGQSFTLARSEKKTFAIKTYFTPNPESELRIRVAENHEGFLETVCTQDIDIELINKRG